jgi:hypothetical protein
MLKSGANEFHGAAYKFLQNSDFNARSFFNPSVGHLAYNYVGGNLRGPINKNKIFFFGDYMRVMDHEGNTNLVTIPPMNRSPIPASPTIISQRWRPARPGIAEAGGTVAAGEVIPFCWPTASASGGSGAILRGFGPVSALFEPWY